jgi:SAM-dependent methyltransferase
MSDPSRFDAAYYRRFYEQSKTRVSDAKAVERLAGFVLGYLSYLRLPVRNVLDLGCGMGHWRTALQKLAPKARHRGVEYSDYLCERFGWEKGSAVDFAPGRTFDLVVCQGVLQYLDDRAAARAIDNLADLTHGALYLEALTKADWQHNVDRTVTDGAVHLRTGEFYRKRLRRHFTPLGGGLFAKKGCGIALFELEELG